MSGGMLASQTKIPPLRQSIGLEPGKRRDVQELFEAMLDAVDVVSFDLFETLIERQGLFCPKDLFLDVRDAAAGRMIAIDEFVTARIRAEEAARVRARGSDKEEVTLEEIYADLGRRAGLTSTAITELMHLELECERSRLITLEAGMRLFRTALQAGKQVVIISDTYFSEEFLGDLLQERGYGAARIYVSSKYGKTKCDGSLYDVVLHELGIEPCKMLHVGDNPLADVTRALGKGLRALLFTTSHGQWKRRHGMPDKPTGNAIVSAMLSRLSRTDVRGTEQEDRRSIVTRTAAHLSLVYFGFAAWLVNQLQQRPSRRVYFASREGLVLKRFFDQAAVVAGLHIDSRYLYVSRAALYPSLLFADPDMARRLFCHHWDHLTFDEALRRLGLGFEEAQGALRSHGISYATLPLNTVTASKLAGIVDRLWPVLRRKNERHLKLLTEYLDKEMALTDEDAAFVDIGWHGTLQYTLEKLLRHLGVSKRVSGYYLGVLAKPPGAGQEF
jgi:predicted HAD superfamily hydrolase